MSFGDAYVESAVRQGQSAYRAALQLKQQGFYPDVILGHSGWGSTLFMRDLFPRAALVGYFEWFYHARGVDLDFDPETGKIYGSLEYKNDAIGKGITKSLGVENTGNIGFYIAVFDASRITKLDMDAEKEDLFEQFENAFCFYNCTNAETGKYPAYYARTADVES